MRGWNCEYMKIGHRLAAVCHYSSLPKPSLFARGCSALTSPSQCYSYLHHLPIGYNSAQLLYTSEHTFRHLNRQEVNLAQRPLSTFMALKQFDCLGAGQIYNTISSQTFCKRNHAGARELQLSQRFLKTIQALKLVDCSGTGLTCNKISSQAFGQRHLSGTSIFSTPSNTEIFRHDFNYKGSKYLMHQSVLVKCFHPSSLDCNKIPQSPEQSDNLTDEKTKLDTSRLHRDSTTSHEPTSDAKPDAISSTGTEVPPEKMGLLKRFHHTYKQYGKILVVVHCITSAVWAGLFYYVAMSGVDVEPALRWIGAGEKIISVYTMPGVGHAAVAYLFYKIATPIRYPVTIGGTHLAVKYMRRLGYMPPVAKENTIRSLVSEGRTQMRDKVKVYQGHIGDLRTRYKEQRKKSVKHKKLKK